jgi:hypothetical protein
MSRKVQLVEPEVPPLFARLFKSDAEKLRKRRFHGLNHLPGIKPNHPVNDDSLVSYYVARDERKQEHIPLVQLEAKSAADDPSLKKLLLASFAMMVVASLAVGVPIIESNINTTSFFGGISVVVLLIVVLGVSTLSCIKLEMKFAHIDHIWDNKVDGFYGPGVRRRMESIRDCMREFKRFVKWRNFMKDFLSVARFIWCVQLILLLAVAFFGSAALPYRAHWPSGAILAAEAVLIFFYWRTYVFYTLFRDPTLQLCIMVNVISREGMPIPEVASPTTSGESNNGE